MVKRRRILMSRGCTCFLLLLAAVLSGCARDPKQRAARFLEEGQHFYQKHDYARAVLQFKNSIQLDPRNPEAHYRLGMAYLAAGDASSALAEFTRATGLKPDYSDAQLMVARIMLASRNQDMLADAQKRMQQLSDAEPANEEAWNTLALADWQIGRRQDAERQFQDALEHFPGNLKAAVSLAQIRLSQNNIEGAAQVLQRAVQESPASALPLVALGEFYLLTGRAADAEQCLHRAIQAEPKNTLPLLELLSLQMRAGRTADAAATYHSLAALAGDRYSALHAAFLFDTGKHSEAIAEFERLAKANPDDRSARTWLIRAYLRTGRMADAQATLNQALHRNPQDIDALLQRGIIHLWSSEFAAAQGDMAEVLHFQPNSAQAHYVLSKVYEAQGALRSERQELAEALRTDPAFLQARIELSQSLIATGQPLAALDLMNRTPEPDKDGLPALIARNWALVATGDSAQLRAGVERALSMGKTPEVLLQSAILDFSRKDYNGARASLTEVLARNPSDLRALDLLTRSYVLENHPDLAIRKLQEYAAAHPRSAAVQYLWGQWMFTRGDRRQARTAFTAAVAVDRLYVPAVLGLARLDADEKKFGDARSLLSALIAERPDTPALLLLADIENTSGDRGSALTHYKAALAIDPDNLMALNNYAYLLADFANQPDNALSYAQRARQLAPDNPAIQDTLGWVLYRKGLYAAALPCFQKAVADGSSGSRLYHLAMAYFQIKDRRRGQQVLQQALQAAPDLPEADVARELQAQLNGG